VPPPATAAAGENDALVKGSDRSSSATRPASCLGYCAGALRAQPEARTTSPPQCCRPVGGAKTSIVQAAPSAEVRLAALEIKIMEAFRYLSGIMLKRRTSHPTRLRTCSARRHHRIGGRQLGCGRESTRARGSKAGSRRSGASIDRDRDRPSHLPGMWQEAKDDQTPSRHAAPVGSGAIS
jgi:hypothetical protein